LSLLADEVTADAVLRVVYVRGVRGRARTLTVQVGVLLVL